MLKAEIVVTGLTYGDLDVALEEVARRLRDGFLSGTDTSHDDYRRVSGSYRYSVIGDEELPTEEIIILYQQYSADRLGIAWEEVDSDEEGFTEAALYWYEKNR